MRIHTDLQNHRLLKIITVLAHRVAQSYDFSDYENLQPVALVLVGKWEGTKKPIEHNSLLHLQEKIF